MFCFAELYAEGSLLALHRFGEGIWAVPLSGKTLKVDGLGPEAMDRLTGNVKRLVARGEGWVESNGDWTIWSYYPL